MMQWQLWTCILSSWVLPPGSPSGLHKGAEDSWRYQGVLPGVTLADGQKCQISVDLNHTRRLISPIGLLMFFWCANKPHRHWPSLTLPGVRKWHPLWGIDVAEHTEVRSSWTAPNCRIHPLKAGHPPSPAADLLEPERKTLGRLVNLVMRPDDRAKFRHPSSLLFHCVVHYVRPLLSCHAVRYFQHLPTSRKKDSKLAGAAMNFQQWLDGAKSFVAWAPNWGTGCQASIPVSLRMRLLGTN